MADEDEPTQKTIVWIGTCREDLRAFPDEVKDEVGHVLSEVQNDRSGTYRVVFTVQFPKAIYGLHAFQKKSKTGSKTPKEEMDRVRQRVSVAEADYEARFG